MVSLINWSVSYWWSLGRPVTTNRVFKVEDGEDVILTDFGNLVTQHHFYLIEAVNTATLGTDLLHFWYLDAVK